MGSALESIKTPSTALPLPTPIINCPAANGQASEALRPLASGQTTTPPQSSATSGALRADSDRELGPATQGLKPGCGLSQGCEPGTGSSRTGTSSARSRE